MKIMVMMIRRRRNEKNSDKVNGFAKRPSQKRKIIKIFPNEFLLFIISYQRLKYEKNEEKKKTCTCESICV